MPGIVSPGLLLPNCYVFFLNIHLPTRNKNIAYIFVGVQYCTIFGSHQLKIKRLFPVCVNRVNVFNKIRCFRSLGGF